jgi:hypothetical protein
LAKAPPPQNPLTASGFPEPLYLSHRRPQTCRAVGPAKAEGHEDKSFEQELSNDYDRTTFYAFDAPGYTDYPFYSEQAA